MKASFVRCHSRRAQEMTRFLLRPAIKSIAFCRLDGDFRASANLQVASRQLLAISRDREAKTKCKNPRAPEGCDPVSYKPAEQNAQILTTDD
jgi:hypothetical protein